jgi:gamma-glutamyltranspeptidase / glutathione hydrolase
MSAQALFALKRLPEDRMDHAAIKLTEARFAFRDRAGEGAALLDAPLQADLHTASSRRTARLSSHRRRLRL